MQHAKTIKFLRSDPRKAYSAKTTYFQFFQKILNKTSNNSKESSQ
jgi:hypothetical protein